MKNLFAVLTVALMCSWTVGCGAPKEPAPAPATPDAPAQTEATGEKKEEVKAEEKPAEEKPADKPEGGSAEK